MGKKQYKHLPYSTVEKALYGNDAEAINQIVKHFQPYIKKFATKQVFDTDGNTYYMVDYELKMQLEIRAILCVLDFMRTLD